MPDIDFRPIRPDDSEFLYTVYAKTRTEELAQVDWPESQKEAFLRSQFNAQTAAYQDYKDADLKVILKDGLPVGRLYIARWPTEIRIMDIALLPEYRRAGIGRGILSDVLAEGKRDAKRVSIHVEVFNPALALYERLGFRTVETRGAYYFMEWLPESST